MTTDTTTTTFLPNLHLFGHAHLNPAGGYQDYFWARNQPAFAPWEVALTVVATVVMVATVVLLVRRLRAG